MNLQVELYKTTTAVSIDGQNITAAPFDIKGVGPSFEEAHRDFNNIIESHKSEMAGAADSIKHCVVVLDNKTFYKHKEDFIITATVRVIVVEKTL